MPTIPHGPEYDAIIQGRADGASGRPKRVLGGFMADCQREYDRAYDLARETAGYNDQ